MAGVAAIGHPRSSSECLGVPRSSSEIIGSHRNASGVPGFPRERLESSLGPGGASLNGPSPD
eukprot:3776552-Lingulodinium_polyedra.AAC.1